MIFVLSALFCFLMVFGGAWFMTWLSKAATQVKRKRAAPTFGLVLPSRHIHSTPAIQGGIPVFTGTRLPVYVVLEALADGETFDSVLEQFDDLTREQLVAAVLHAADMLHKFPSRPGDGAIP